MTTDVQPAGLTRAYPREMKLANGKKIELHLMDASVRDELLTFARSLPKQDVLFLRMDLTDPRNIDEWIRNVQNGRTITVLAYDNSALAGWAEPAP